MTQPLGTVFGTPGDVVNPLAYGGGVPIPGLAPSGDQQPSEQELLWQQEDAELQEQLAAQRAKQQRQKELEAKHGKLGVIGIQATRGALDMLMGSGTLLGLGIEATGEFTGAPLLKNFGRELGKSASGTEFLSVFSGLASGDVAEGYDAAKSYIKEQQEARPVLSALSHAAGSAMFAMIGGLATGGAKAVIASGAIEGAGAGAQVGYGADASLRDVLTSTVIGAGLGAAVSAGAEAAFHYGVPILSKAAQRFAERRSVKALAGNYKKAYDELTYFGKQPERLQRVGKKLLDRGIPTENLDEAIDALAGELDNSIVVRQAVAEGLDSAGLRPSSRALLEKVTAQVDELKAIPLGDFQAVARKVEGQIAPFKKKVSAGRVFRGGKGEENIKDLTFSEMWDLRKHVDDTINWASAQQSPARDALRKLRRTIDDSLTDTIENSGDKGAFKAWKEAGEDYHDFRTVKDAAERLKEMTEKNRFISASDYGTGGALGVGSIMAMIGSGGAAIPSILLGSAVGAGASFAHKFARQKGSAYLSKAIRGIAGAGDDAGHGAVDAALRGASRFKKAAKIGIDRGADVGRPGGYEGYEAYVHAAHAGEHVTVSQAGGREAQEAINTYASAIEYIEEAAEKAGPNPLASQSAREHAIREVTERLHAQAGPYDASLWSAKAPTPLQKIAYRGPILDQVSRDLATDAANLQPPALDFDLDPQRLGKLLKDADAPAAIGALHATLQNISTEVPKTPTGDLLRAELRAAVQVTRQQGASGTMVEGHKLARNLERVAQGAADEVTRSWAQRSAAAIRADLGSQSFGEAGALYRSLSPEPDEAFAALTDPAKLREELSQASARGNLSAAVRKRAEALDAAYDAQYKLSGSPVKSSAAIRQDAKRVEQAADKADEAVTMDGASVGRVFDHFTAKGQASPIGNSAMGTPEEVLGNLVANSVGPELDRLIPAMTSGARYSPRARGKSLGAAAAATAALTMPELQERYQERLELLADAVVGGDANAVAGTLRRIPGIPAEIQPIVAADYFEKLSTLLQDMPKPLLNIRGPAFEALSSDDLRKANAMWEGTTDPLSVFSDFERGALDYDKVQYAWKQYPGLKLAAQVGLQDLFYTQMDDAERAAIPESMLTQLDNMMDLRGSFQNSVDKGFSQRMTALGAAQTQQNKPKPDGMLSLNTSEPTFTERLSGRKR